MIFLAMLSLVLGADGTINAQCTRHDTNDHHNRTYWDMANATGSTSICAELYRVQLSDEWVAYRPGDGLKPAQHFGSKEDAVAWIVSQATPSK